MEHRGAQALEAADTLERFIRVQAVACPLLTRTRDINCRFGLQRKSLGVATGAKSCHFNSDPASRAGQGPMLVERRRMIAKHGIKGFNSNEP
jgi:hypothetical protein